jgi:hypothetical protein
MAHRRAVPRRGRGIWLLIPLALALDAATALSLNARALPSRMVIPEVVILAVPVVVYGALAFFALRTWPLAWRLSAAAALLGMHAGLVALHTAAYVVIWSFPAPAALRLAHRWSPLVPLFQLLWVPLLALPLAIEIDRRRRPAPTPPRRVPTRIPVEVLVARASQAGSQARSQPRPQPDSPRIPVEPPRSEPAPDAVGEIAAAATVVEATSPPVVLTVPPSSEVTASPRDTPVTAPSVSEMPAETIEAVSAPPAAPSREVAPVPAAPTWFDELAGPSARPIPPEAPLSAPARDAYVIEDATLIGSPEPVAERREPEVAPEPVVTIPPVSTIEMVTSEPVAAAPPAPSPVTLAPRSDAVHQASVPLPTEARAEDLPAEESARRTATPPLDLDLVARAFAPYGPLLSRDRAVQVHWVPDADVPVVCVAPRDMSRDRIARLAARMLAAGGEGPEPLRRLALRDPEGVIVLTPLDGAVLATASRRPGGVALLEALSARLVAGDGAASAEAPDASGATAVSAQSGVQVETSAATLEIFAPSEVAVTAVGQLIGRLLAALAVDGIGPETLQDLAVSLRAHRVAVQPVHSATRPPRFVVMVGETRCPGLLGRRAERAARAVRIAS